MSTDLDLSCKCCSLLVNQFKTPPSPIQDAQSAKTLVYIYIQHAGVMSAVSLGDHLLAERGPSVHLVEVMPNVLAKRVFPPVNSYAQVRLRSTWLHTVI